MKHAVPVALKRVILITLLGVFFLLTGNNTKGQGVAKDSTTSGEIKGVVRDSAYNFVLNNATIAIYRDADSSLLQFGTPNKFGEFSIKSLPAGIWLRTIITHIGYKPFYKKLLLPTSTPVRDFGNINMYVRSDSDSGAMEEVTVTAVAPMRMNGDTLEFNADAFRLDSNATAEDLMRRLPGFTVWGDGDITYNGKKITSILVNGKPFLGGDFSVITQNLPKNAVDKVQLYQQKNESNPLDSTMNANIKLKKEVDIGHFGKLSGGLGTDKRYAADGMLGYFNRKMQLSVVAAGNNVNKVAEDVEELVKNSTFKGVGAAIDYQPDFRMEGLNRPFAAGATFQYDFLPEVDYYNANRLTADYFLNRSNTLTERNTLANTLLGTDSVLTQKSYSANTDISTSQRASSGYERNTQLFRFSAHANVTANDSRSFDTSQSDQERTGLGQVSINHTSNESRNNNRSYNLTLDFEKEDPDRYTRDRRFINNYSIVYDLNVSDNRGSNKRTTSFRSAIDPGADRDYSRFYEQQDALSVSNHIYVKYPNLKKLLFGKLRLGDIQIEAAANLFLTNNDYHDRVLDLDTVTSRFGLNTYLTNTRDQDVFNLLPAITISKSFWKRLSNRYSKYVNLSASAKSQHYNFHHTASQAIQNIDYSYNKFVPQASVSYSNNQYGAFDLSASLQYSTKVNYPQINQLAPLIDSSNVLYLPMSNLNLQPQRDHTISWNYSYTGRTKNPLIWSINANIGKVNSFITDSTIYDDIGRRMIFHVNLDGRQFLNGAGSIRKSYQKGKNNTYQIGLQTNYGINRNPNYINSVYNISKVISSDSRLNVDYAFKDLLALKFEQGLNLYRSMQQGFNNNSLKSQTFSTMFSGSLQLPQNLNWSSNITFNRAKADELEAINFAIWNANITYRFLRGNRGEVKFSALDLLRQNKAIINSVSGNTQSFGYVNVLQQYYMITLSYFPRKFGR